MNLSEERYFNFLGVEIQGPLEVNKQTNKHFQRELLPETATSNVYRDQKGNVNERSKPE